MLLLENILVADESSGKLGQLITAIYESDTRQWDTQGYDSTDNGYLQSFSLEFLSTISDAITKWGVMLHVGHTEGVSGAFIIMM